MTIVRVVPLGEALNRLPDIQELDPGGLVQAGPASLYLCALGFEDRCLKIPELLEKANFHALESAYFEYSVNRADNEGNKPQLLRCLSAFSGERLRSIEADSTEMPERMRTLLDFVVAKSRSGDIPLVVFDISVASNKVILKAMKVLMEYNVALWVLYSEAAEYLPSFRDWESSKSAWKEGRPPGSTNTEKGLRDIAVSEEHHGAPLEPQSECLIVFPNFSPDRSLAAISLVDPALPSVLKLLGGGLPGVTVVWVIGMPHDPENAWRIDAVREINPISKGADVRICSTFDYKETLRVLDGIVSGPAKESHVTLAAVGSKMQALGASLFYELHPEIRVILSTPSHLDPSNYSKGCAATWEVRIGSLRAIKQALGRIGSIEILDSPP